MPARIFTEVCYSEPRLALILWSLLIVWPNDYLSGLKSVKSEIKLSITALTSRTVSC